MNRSLWQRTTQLERHHRQRISADQLDLYQLSRLNGLLAEILPANPFYVQKLGSTQLQLDSLHRLEELPYTYKHELIGDEASGGFAKNLTWPIERYTRYHRTSGTKGRPLAVLDTENDWAWWLEAWQSVLDAFQLSQNDRVVMAFSFGPFIGFWSAFDAALDRRCLVAPAGAMQSVARLEMIRELQATVIFSTPSYALHLAEVAFNQQIRLSDLSVRAIVVAGEPGGSIPEVRNQIEEAWGAKVIDHAGSSEVGPWGFPDAAGQGIHVNEAEFIPEFISVATGDPANDGELSELVLTTLGRYGSPIIRYRTGDLVRPTWSQLRSGDGHAPGEQACNFVMLAGGVLGRTDDMMIIRGVNVYPSAIERILRSFPEVIEYRMTAFRESSLDQLKIEIEDRLEHPERVQQELQIRIGLRIDVECVPMGSLPRFEGKGKRFIDLR